MLKALRFSLFFFISLSAYGAQKNPYYVEAQFGYGGVPIIDERIPRMHNFGAGVNLGSQIDDSSSVELSILKDSITTMIPDQAIKDRNNNTVLVIQDIRFGAHIIYFNLIYKKILSTSNDGKIQIYSKLGAGPALYSEGEASTDRAATLFATKLILPTVLAELGVRYSIGPNITAGFSAALVGIKIFAFGAIIYHLG